MSTTTPVIKSFSIDSTLELVSDHFTMDTPDSELFRSASTADRVFITAGLLASSSGPANVLHSITNGVIDEYEITVTPNNVVGAVRGRDPSAAILDGYFDGLFVRPTEPFLRREVLPDAPPFVTFAPGDVGRHLASEIAAKVVEAVGLTVRWEVRDYELEQNFRASGRVIDALRELIQPWTLLEPFKAEIFLQGTEVIIRHRQDPNVPMVADYSLDLGALRRSQLVIRKRRLRKIGKVTLRGRKEPPSLQGDRRFKIVPSNQDVTVIDAGGGTTEQTITHEAFDDSGNLISLVTTKETYRMPDRVLLKSIKTTLTGGPGIALKLTMRETITKTYETPVYDAGGAANSPLPETETVIREGIANDSPSETDPAKKVFRVLETETRQWKYDEQRHQTGESITKKVFNFDTFNLEFSTLTVKTLHDIGSLLVEEITETYAFDLTDRRWIRRTRDTATSGGHRPGGFGRGQSTAGTTTAGSAEVDNIKLEQTISTDVDAQNVEYTNENLKLEDLQFIMNQFVAAHQLIEFELIFEGVAMPWLRRGAKIQLTGVSVEDGIPLDLPVALLTEVRTRYDEGSQNASYTMSCRAFGWSSG